MHGLVKYLSNRAFHLAEYMAGREDAEQRHFEASLIFIREISRRGKGRGVESNRGFIGSLRNWLKYISVSRGNSPSKEMPFENSKPCFPADCRRRSLFSLLSRAALAAEPRSCSLSRKLVDHYLYLYVTQPLLLCKIVLPLSNARIRRIQRALLTWIFLCS